jgi:catechol 2,3-dioxygenase-like lactoylglutathione lyase family enzyme
MFDLLINAEIIVDDVDIAERVFVDALGFPEPRHSWGGTVTSAGFAYLFARVHPSLKVSPTRVEAMAVAPIDAGGEPFLPKLLAAQGRRPWKTHGNELAAPNIDAVVARLEANGCRFYTMQGEGGYPFIRIWLGWTAGDVGEYRPDVDGGLMFEICETESLLQGPALWAPQPDPVLPPGSMIRVVRRSWIVEDLRDSLASIDRNLGWRPALGPETDQATGCRRAVFHFAHPRSAELELLEPVGAGEVRESLDTWGPGSWTIRIGVNDLAAKATDLRRRGTAFESYESAADGAVVRVNTDVMNVPGLFEFAPI